MEQRCSPPILTQSLAPPGPVENEVISISLPIEDSNVDESDSTTGNSAADEFPDNLMTDNKFSDVRFREKSYRLRVIEWAVFIIFVAAIICGLYLLSAEYLEPVLHWHSQLDGIVNVLVFGVLVFVVSLPMMIGYVVTCVGAGYIYGAMWGTVIVSIATLASAAIVFAISRFFFRESADRKAAQYTNFHAIRTILENHSFDGLKMIMMLRLSPIPVGITTMLLSICDITVWWQSLGTFLGMLPTQVFYCTIGSTLPSIDSVTNDKFNPYIIATEVVLMCTVTWYIGISVQRAIKNLTTILGVDNGSIPILAHDHATKQFPSSYSTFSHNDDNNIGLSGKCATPCQKLSQ